MTVILTISGIFSGIKFVGKLHIYAYICGPVCGAVFLSEMMIGATYMARLHTYSTTIKKSCKEVQLKSPLHTDIFQKTVASFRAVRFNIGDLYFVDQGTMLELVFMVFDEVINLLISM